MHCQRTPNASKRATPSEKELHAQVLKKRGLTASGVFLDLGISSPQFDDTSRGFRLEADGPLDLRFNVERAPRAERDRGEPTIAELVPALCCQTPAKHLQHSRHVAALCHAGQTIQIRCSI